MRTNIHVQPSPSQVEHVGWITKVEIAAPCSMGVLQRETQLFNWGFSEVSLSLHLYKSIWPWKTLNLESLVTSSRCSFYIPSSSAWWERM
ncbi:hypothetical protein PRUPE_6G107100 [Prunus persica]|uniref:Uncharacterized protein n=1 Tax=Prunus persica TaxID=3760 RepID=A0A251NNE8_PRUPE|nr:hypothetical protein PRUPE_6G107100 [Prunus persica]